MSRVLSITTDDGDQKINIPDDAVITFGPLVPKHHQTAVRIYNSKKEILACFNDVRTFYDTSQVSYVERRVKPVDPPPERRIAPAPAAASCSVCGALMTLNLASGWSCASCGSTIPLDESDNVQYA